MKRNVTILLDNNATDASLICDHNKFIDPDLDVLTCAFVDGIGCKNLKNIFENYSNINNEFSYGEIVGEIWNHNKGNDTEMVKRLIETCTKNEVKAKVYFEHNDVESLFLSDSLYTDYLLFSNHLIRRALESKESSDYMEAFMKMSKCPVMLVSQEQKQIENIVFMYDGSIDSFNGIKQFTKVFSSLIKNAGNAILYIVVNDISSDQERHLYNYIKSYRQNFSIHRVFPDTYFNDLISLLYSLDNFLLVTGTGRNELTEEIMFHKGKSFFLQGPRSIFMG